MRRFLFGLAGFAGCGPQAQRRFAPPTRAPPVRPPAAGGLRPSGSCTLFHLRGTPGRRDAAFFGSLQGAGCGPQARRRFAPPTRAPPVRPPQAGGLRPSGSCTLFHLRGTPGRRDAAFSGRCRGPVAGRRPGGALRRRHGRSPCARLRRAACGPPPRLAAASGGAARLQKPSFSANPPVFPASDTGLRQNTAGRQR